MEVQTTKYMLILLNKLVDEWLVRYGKLMPNSNEIVTRKSLWIEHQDNTVYIHEIHNKETNKTIKSIILYNEDEDYRIIFKLESGLYCTIYKNNKHTQWQFAKIQYIIKPLTVLLNGTAIQDMLKEVDIVDYDTSNLKVIQDKTC